jgi:hypothetical protein
VRACCIAYSYGYLYGCTAYVNAYGYFYFYCK